MKALHKVLIAIVLSMTAVFLGVGFANTTVDIEVAGTANILPPEAVYITSVTVNSTSGTATADEGTYLMTAHSSTLDLGSNKNSTVTYSITVYNNTGETYAYNAAKYIQDAYSNANVTFALTNPDGSAFKHGAEVEAGKSLTFNVTFSYNDKNSISDTALTSTINYEFLPLDELPEEEEIAVSGALEQFRKIINDLVFDGSYDDLIEQMDKAAANDRHDSSYIGNVTGASPDDSALLNDLFQGQLILNINGKEEPVTILIKRENLDGNVNTGDADGNEMTIYMTTDDLQWSWSHRSAVVYAAVYTSTNDGETWSILGEMYEGTAPIKTYSGWFGSGSFDTDEWKSTDNKTIEQKIASAKV
ncbi:MAG: hypothetical protein E7382_02655 [Clostridiales bacterium]|nr:hypothetical protein [Clostridiales bacterium]